MADITIQFKNIYLKFDPRYPDKIWMGRGDGEGGQFDMSQFEELIEKFYEENF